MKTAATFFSCFLACWTSLASAASYDARIAEKEILTPPPPLAPRINGPALYGARPGRQFVYRIPTQGARPMRFEVMGLPEGMKLDAENGIITGMTPPKKGDYRMTFSAKNNHGETSLPFKLVIGDQLALTPPTGWNSWGGHMLMVTDSIMRKAADLMVDKGLADVGFQYVSIDDCWMRISTERFAARDEGRRKKHEGFNFDGMIGETRDPKGDIIPNRNFPDMKAMTDYIHARGLKAGLYSSPGPNTCQDFAGSFGHEPQDAAQYAEWGFDLLKYDLCSGGRQLRELKKNPDFKIPDYWKPMADALREQNRDILFNLCEYGDGKPWNWAPGIGIQTWRTGGDLNHNVASYFHEAMRIATQLRDASKSGQWNDPDFLYIHKIRDHRHMMAPSQEVPLNTNQRYQYATLWSIVCAPYFFSCDINEIDEFTIRLLANADVLAINQDELGQVAKVVRNAGAEVVMIKEMANGARALALFNTDAAKTAEIKLEAEWLGNESPAGILDAWRQKKVENFKAGDTVSLSPSGVALFIIPGSKESP